MRRIFTLLLFLSTLLLAWTYVNRVGDEQPAPGELIVYINSDTQPGEGVAAEARWPSGGPYTYANTRDQGTSEYGSFLGGTANWKVTFDSGVLPNNMSIDYQVMGIGTDNNFYSYSGFNWTVDGALPVELTTFTAFAKEKEVILNWETATEVNNYGFYVERSSLSASPRQDGWEKIGFVEGHGNSNSPKTYSYLDNSVNSGKYEYRLKQVDIDGSFEYSETVEVNLEIPTEFKLAQNYPNPFNPVTTIKYSIPLLETLPETSSQNKHVLLKVFDVLGQEVATLVNKEQNAGTYEIEFDASELNSGIYIYSLQTSQSVINRKMILMK